MKQNLIRKLSNIVDPHIGAIGGYMTGGALCGALGLPWILFMVVLALIVVVIIGILF